MLLVGVLSYLPLVLTSCCPRLQLRPMRVDVFYGTRPVLLSLAACHHPPGRWPHVAGVWSPQEDIPF